MDSTIDIENERLQSEQASRAILRKSVILTFIISFLSLGAITFLLPRFNDSVNQQDIIIPQISSTPTPKEDLPFGAYSPPKISKKDVYTIFMVGDSMTESLGPHGGKLNEIINTLYQSTPGNQRIVIDNYASGSTNILGLQDVMKQKTVVGDAVLDPLLSRPYDVLLIESFGYNPLSQLGKEEGLKKQTQILDELMKLLTKAHPQSQIVFVATIAPNKETYAQEVALDKTTADRMEQAQERIDYINNHIAYAKAHNIPLINIYDKSLTPNGDGNLLYINPDDHIHPSFAGHDFISEEIANFIFENQILPR